MEISRQTTNGIDISALTVVHTFTHTGNSAIIIISRVDLGSVAKPIAGGTTYGLQVQLNGVAVTPLSALLVGGDQHQAIAESRAIVIGSGDVVTVHVLGAAGDTDVWVDSILFDSTPAQLADLTGRGGVVVDHNYGGTDALTAVDGNGIPMDNVQIRAYLRSHWNNNMRGAEYIVASTRTDVNGRWETPMLLDAANYILLYSKQGVVSPKSVAVTVS